MNEDLIATITNARFTPVFKEGYAMGVVDEFLDGVVTRLSAGAPVRPMIEALRNLGGVATQSTVQTAVILSCGGLEGSTERPTASPPPQD